MVEMDGPLLSAYFLRTCAPSLVFGVAAFSPYKDLVGDSNHEVFSVQPGCSVKRSDNG